MTKLELINITTLMGLTYNSKDNYPHKTNMYFNGCNGQRVMLSTTMSIESIYVIMGKAMKLYGRRQLKMDLNNLLNITSDN